MKLRRGTKRPPGLTGPQYSIPSLKKRKLKLHWPLLLYFSFMFFIMSLLDRYWSNVCQQKNRLRLLALTFFLSNVYISMQSLLSINKTELYSSIEQIFPFLMIKWFLFPLDKMISAQVRLNLKGFVFLFSWSVCQTSLTPVGPRTQPISFLASDYTKEKDWICQCKIIITTVEWNNFWKPSSL